MPEHGPFNQYASHANQQYYPAPEPQQTEQAEQPKTRWDTPLQLSEVDAFSAQYMTWVRPRETLQNNPESNSGEELPVDKSSQEANCNWIEQTQKYKELVKKNPAAAAAMKAGVKCPDRLAIYIERAFSKCIDDIEREFMRAQLEKICGASKERGDFFVKQWELMPLPCLQRESK